MQDVPEHLQRVRTGMEGFARSLWLGSEKRPEPALFYDLEGAEVSQILTLNDQMKTYHAHCLAVDQCGVALCQSVQV